MTRPLRLNMGKPTLTTCNCLISSHYVSQSEMMMIAQSLMMWFKNLIKFCIYVYYTGDEQVALVIIK